MFYAIILIFLGGIIIIFIYVTTLAGNEKFLIPFNFNLLYLPIRRLIIIRFLGSYPILPKEIFFIHTYLSSTTPILWFLFTFLLITLFVVIKIAESFKGVLVKFS